MEIIYPMAALVFLTFTVAISMGIGRVVSIKQGLVKASDYRYPTGQVSPEAVTKLERNFSNLLEVPVLFYALCLAILALNISSPLLVNLAWLFVGLRLIHTLIHVTYNHTLHRFVPFLCSTLLLLYMWLELILLLDK